MSQSSSWKEQVRGQIPSHLEQEIAIYETQLALKSQGKIDDKVFAETRLRRGVYGQRYDNGQRHDGRAHAATRLPMRRADQRSTDGLGCARHAAYQDPLWWPEC